MTDISDMRSQGGLSSHYTQCRCSLVTKLRLKAEWSNKQELKITGLAEKQGRKPQTSGDISHIADLVYFIQYCVICPIILNHS